MSDTKQWTAKELAKHISGHVLSADAIEYLINQLLNQKVKEDIEQLVKTAYIDATGIYKNVPCKLWWPQFKLQNNP
jgi:hypothetical protein